MQYVIQKVFEVGSPEHLDLLKEKMKGMGIDMDDETGDSMLEHFAGLS